MKNYKPTISEEILLKDEYKKFVHPEAERILYQKKVVDEKGIKYFINCYYDEIKTKENLLKFWNFSIQIKSEQGTVNIETVQWFNQDGIYTGKNHLNAEEYFEKMWMYHGKNYYEEFVKRRMNNEF